jgi:hypothetical protein
VGLTIKVRRDGRDRSRVEDRVVALHDIHDARIGEDDRRVLGSSPALPLVPGVGSKLGDNGWSAVELLEQVRDKVGLQRGYTGQDRTEQRPRGETYLSGVMKGSDVELELVGESSHQVKVDALRTSGGDVSPV